MRTDMLVFDVTTIAATDRRSILEHEIQVTAERLQRLLAEREQMMMEPDGGRA